MSVCFAIAYGSIKIGIVGHEQRMEAISISEQRVITSFLTKIAGKYNASIINTEEVLKAIRNFKSRYHYRCLGYVYLLSTNCLEIVYDVFDGDIAEDVDIKKQTKKLFEQGIELFYEKKFFEARQVFIEVLKIYRRDSASREYLYLCDKYYGQEASENADLFIETI